MIFSNFSKAFSNHFIPYVQPKLSAPASTLPNTASVDAGTKFYLNKNGADDIYYTWNRTTPTKQSIKYSDNIGLTIPTGKTTCTLKAFGVKEGYQDSNILEVTYTIKQEKPSEEESSATEESNSNERITADSKSRKSLLWRMEKP